ncbi:MAG: NTF2 fold immunity protein [Chthoniobacterales bacterium]
MMRQIRVGIVLLLYILCVKIVAAQGYVPKECFIPDEKTAVSVAVAIWNPIYGEDIIAKERPYKAKLVDGVWYVSATFNSWWGIRKGFNGGAAEAEIDKKTGAILKVYHTK